VTLRLAHNTIVDSKKTGVIRALQCVLDGYDDDALTSVYHRTGTVVPMEIGQGLIDLDAGCYEVRQGQLAVLAIHESATPLSLMRGDVLGYFIPDVIHHDERAYAY